MNTNNELEAGELFIKLLLDYTKNNNFIMVKNKINFYVEHEYYTKTLEIQLKKKVNEDDVIINELEEIKKDKNFYLLYKNDGYLYYPDDDDGDSGNVEFKVSDNFKNYLYINLNDLSKKEKIDLLCFFNEKINNGNLEIDKELYDKIVNENMLEGIGFEDLIKYNFKSDTEAIGVFDLWDYPLLDKYMTDLHRSYSKKEETFDSVVKLLSSKSEIYIYNLLSNCKARNEGRSYLKDDLFKNISLELLQKNQKLLKQLSEKHTELIPFLNHDIKFFEKTKDLIIKHISINLKDLEVFCNKRKTYDLKINVGLNNFNNEILSFSEEFKDLGIQLINISEPLIQDKSILNIFIGIQSEKADKITNKILENLYFSYLNIFKESDFQNLLMTKEKNGKQGKYEIKAIISKWYLENVALINTVDNSEGINKLNKRKI